MSTFRIFPSLAASIIFALESPVESFATMGEWRNERIDAHGSGFCSLHQDPVALRREVASLNEHAKYRATNRVQYAAGQIDRGARDFRREVEAEGERSARTVSLVIEKQPLLGLIVAIGIVHIGLAR
jgi:hypothetical protein